MCGIAGMFGPGTRRDDVEAMVRHQRHRGPDAHWTVGGADLGGAIGSDRLSVIDLSPGADVPLVSPRGTRIAFNGEIYNHVELRRELGTYPFRTSTDTEVLLAAYERWGDACLDRLVGMFAVIFWNDRTGEVLAARDRFGVKPLYHHRSQDGTVRMASEIGALFAGGVEAVPDEAAWSAYLGDGLLDHATRTFWDGVTRLRPGHVLRLRGREVITEPWYDLAAEVGDATDTRPDAAVIAEYRDLLLESVRLRFRSDVPVGVALSGGLDSSILLGLIETLPEDHPPVAAYTFATGDERYDETSWVAEMLASTRHTGTVVTLQPDQVPALATSVQAHQDEPFGGLPSLAYAQLFERARDQGTVVMLDGQGMDEQWAGYDYYRTAAAGGALSRSEGPLGPVSRSEGPLGPVSRSEGPLGPVPLVQGIADQAVRPGSLRAPFRSRATPFAAPEDFSEPLRRLQHRDLSFTKLPRALRYNDRISMRSSVELREPFLDHRLVELALRQPPDRKLRDGTTKWLLRQIAADMVPKGVGQAPKRPVQTPQREWLRGPLRSWASARIESALEATGGQWLEARSVRAEWASFTDGVGDNSYFVWSWISLGLAVEQRPQAFAHLG